MSFRKEYLNHFISTESNKAFQTYQGYSIEKLMNLFRQILENGTHGFCFSVYEEGQKPGDVISEEQIIRRLNILKPHTKWIRTFSCSEDNDKISRIAKKLGFKTLVGAWLGSDKEKNEEEISGLVGLAKEGCVDLAAVGNEVLYRKDLTLEELIKYIQEVRCKIPHVPVGYVDAYYEFTLHPELVEVSDVLLCNLYPYWEGTPIEHAMNHVKHMHQQVKNVSQNKPIIITETGWPSQGEATGNAVPSELSMLIYFIQVQLWCLENNHPLFYFSSFDESWKVGSEGTVGAYWGVWDKHETLKF